MKRLFPALAFLTLLASGSEANACGGWCSRFFASVFGGQNVQVPNEETPLIVRPQQLPVQPPVLQIERRPVPEVGQPPVRIRRDVPRAINDADARDLFRRAYGISGTIVTWHRLDFIEDALFRNWLGTIDRLDVTADNTSVYSQRWGHNFVSLAVDVWGVGVLEYSASRHQELADSGQAIRLPNDTEAGLVARAIVGQGGPRLLSSIAYHFNSTDHLYFFSELPDGSRENLLEMANYSYPGDVLRRLLNYEAIDVDPVPDDSQPLPNDIWVRFGSRQDARDAQDDRRERLNEPEDEKKDE